MSQSNKICELTTFGINLGKAFRKHVEEMEKRVDALQREVKALKHKNIKIDKDMSEWDTEDLEERMITNEREFEELKANLNNIMDKNDTSSKDEIKNLNINLNKFPLPMIRKLSSITHNNRVLKIFRKK